VADGPRRGRPARRPGRRRGRRARLRPRAAPRYPRRALVGVSQGAFFVDTFLAEGFNAVPGGGRAYQQALTVDGNGNWMMINQLAGTRAQSPYLLPDGRPLSYGRMLRRPASDPLLVDVANYTDFYRLRAGFTGREGLPAGVRRAAVSRTP
jgi:hypothetical protein